MEKDKTVLTDHVTNLRSLLDHSRVKKHSMEEQLLEAQILLRREQEQLRMVQKNRASEVETARATSSRVVQDIMAVEVEQKRKMSQNDSGMQLQDGEEVFGDLPARVAEMEVEIRVLRDQNKTAREDNEELHAQLHNKGLEERRTLMKMNQEEQTNSLAAEFEAMSVHEMQKALQQQKNKNLELQTFIDSVQLDIMERCPQMLEIRKK
eukprot:GFUD01124260.1.p1 GENE.GFUD01124260.1~~GFUD01124260.1.p1  ORF type:complete len:231 (-),score=89.22 GFUD01124260.1:122-745(-)